MKTIAISIDDETLARVDRLAGARIRTRTNRSLVIRRAVKEYVDRLERERAEQQEAAIVRRHRRRLAEAAAALVREQAKP